MDGTCSADRERRGSYRVLVGKPEGKRPLGRRRHTCVYIQKGISKILFGVGEGGEGECVDSIDLTLARDRWRVLMTEMMNLGAP